MLAPFEVPSLAGRNILITGGTSGIGLEAAVVLARAGADVAVVGRDLAKTERVSGEIQERAGRPLLAPFLCDFASQRQVRALAAAVLERMPTLHVLVNNAGTVNASRRLTEDGIEHTFAVNHLGYVLLTELLLARLRESAPARIVNVASTGHYRGTLDFDDLGFEEGYAIMSAYSRSKLGNVLYTRRLARVLAGSGVTANTLHPGAVATNIWTGAPGWAAPILTLATWFMRSAEEGGRTLVYLAACPEVEGRTGLYFHDNKERRPSKLAQDDALADRLWLESARLVGLPA